jgi:hypothetical protein
MAVGKAVRTPGAEWQAIVQKNGAKESAAAFASNAVLESSVMNGPCVGSETIASVFAAVAGGMYDSLTFTSEIGDGRKTYLEWEGKTFGKDVGGATILSRNEAGLIQSVRLYHRPLQIVLQFSEELAKRLEGKVDPSLFRKPV